jgi:hypothetical protein
VVKLTTCGWEEAEEWFDRLLAELFAVPQGWLIYNTHGLDGEGWGPLRSEYLERLLEGLTLRQDLLILPAREILNRHAAL